MITLIFDIGISLKQERFEIHGKQYSNGKYTSTLYLKLIRFQVNFCLKIK